MTHFSERPFKTRFGIGIKMAGYLSIYLSGGRPSESLSTRMWMWRVCQGRPVVCMFTKGRYIHSTALHSQRIPLALALPLPSPTNATIHTCLKPCPCLFLVAVRHVSLSLVCPPLIRCTFLRALNARRPKDRVRDNGLLSVVQPPLFAATLWPPPRPAQPSTTSTTSHTNIPHPVRTPRALRGASQHSTFDRISPSQQGSCTAAHKLEADPSRVAGANGSSADRKLFFYPSTHSTLLYLQRSSFSVAHAVLLLR